MIEFILKNKKELPDWLHVKVKMLKSSFKLFTAFQSTFEKLEKICLLNNFPSK